MLLAVKALRAATGGDHDHVDAAFGGFDLGDRQSYAAFLHAHARALPAVEAVLAARPDIPAVRPRASALAADLAALGQPVPAPLPFDLPETDGHGWGALYVVEGSRLGGTLLARSVAQGWPSAYLGASHVSGEWRVLLAAIDARASGEAWIADAIDGARATFALYAAAVAGEPGVTVA